MRRNEYENLNQFVYEYAYGRNLYSDNGPQYMGIEFRYNGQYYRMCREPLSEDEMIKLPNGRLGQYDVLLMRCSKHEQYPECEEFVLIGWYSDLDDVLNNCIIDGLPFKEVIISPDTEILGKD